MAPKEIEGKFCGEVDAPSSRQSLVLVDRSVTPPKKTRRRESKVRTGCFTCKTRRVKCDEAKPDCTRCLKFGVQCEGYPSANKKVIQLNPRAILPKARIPLTAKSFHVAPTYALNTGARFLDDNEQRCFTIYCDEMASQLKGPFPTSLWDRLIPQNSEIEPFIRHAVIGIGALSKIKRDSASSKVPGSSIVAVPDYSYALKQYGKALKGVRAEISKGKPDINKILIACILMFCFETLQGKPGAAIANATGGMMLLFQWLQAHANQSAEFFLSDEWREQHTEEDLMTALAGLDLQVLFFLDSRPESVHWFMIDCANKIIPRMPARFATLIAARKFWSLIMRRNFHFIKIALTRAKSHELAGFWKYGSEAPWEDCVDLFPGGNMFCTPKEPAMEMEPDSLLYQEDIRRWSAASADIFNTVDHYGSQEEKILVALLRMHALISHIMLAGAFFLKETQYDTFFPEFREIMSLLEYTHPHITSTGSYCFELGIIIGIFLIGCRCRERETRDRAVAMMSMKEFREGLWDTGTAAIFVKTGRDIEEESRDENGFIPEHKRTFATCAFVDLAGRKGILGYVKRGLEGLEFFEKFYQY